MLCWFFHWCAQTLSTSNKNAAAEKRHFPACFWVLCCFPATTLTFGVWLDEGGWWEKRRYERISPSLHLSHPNKPVLHRSWCWNWFFVGSAAAPPENLLASSLARSQVGAVSLSRCKSWPRQQNTWSTTTMTSGADSMRNTTFCGKPDASHDQICLDSEQWARLWRFSVVQATIK